MIYKEKESENSLDDNIEMDIKSLTNYHIAKGLMGGPFMRSLVSLLLESIPKIAYGEYEKILNKVKSGRITLSAKELSSLILERLNSLDPEFINKLTLGFKASGAATKNSTNTLTFSIDLFNKKKIEK